MAMHKPSANGNLLPCVLSLAVAVTYTVGCMVISLDSCVAKLKNCYIFSKIHENLYLQKFTSAW